MFAAVLDTCVLWPSLQRDFLLSLAVERLYRPLWSTRILEELEYHEAEKLRRRGVPTASADSRAAHLVRTMSTAFDDAMVTEWERCEGAFGLPDPDDEHVVAAALVGGADAIVTDNVSDFPEKAIPEHIHIVRPAEFAANTVAVAPEAAWVALTEMCRRYRNPPVPVDDVLATLVTRYGMSEAVDLLTQST